MPGRECGMWPRCTASFLMPTRSTFSGSVLAQMMQVDLAVTVGRAGAAAVAVDAPLEEALAVLAGEDAVVLAAGHVPTHHAVHLQPDCSSSPGSVSLAVPQGEAEEAAGGLQGPGASALGLPPLCGRTFPAGASGRAPASLALSTAHPGIRPGAAAGFLWDSSYNFSVLLCLSF